MLLKDVKVPGYEKVIYAQDDITGLRCYIAIHSTILGPALGGTRIWKYDSDDDALQDVLRLSEGMTYKNSLANLDLGGGKAVINLSGTEKTEELIKSYANAVEFLQGTYITAEDVGTTPEDMKIIKTVTDHVAYNPAVGSPSPATAYGVLQSMRGACKFVYSDDDLHGSVVAIQGLGNVGYALAEMLHRNHAKLIVTDLNKDICEKARQDLNATVVDLDEIYNIECDIFAPCAMGAILNDETVPALNCDIVCGSANNQLSRDEIGNVLQSRGIYYVPDYLANSGGVINVFREFGDVATDFHTCNIINELYDRTIRCLRIAGIEEITTSAVARMFAMQRLDID